MYTLRNLGEMILDAGRMGAYERALRQAVRPGCVVLDIGTGTGIFALLAARFGARRVFALEPAESVFTAREIARANGLSETIEFIQSVSAEVTLPERADVVVSDLRGTLPLFGAHLAAIADARRRHLAPGGVMIPASDTLWAAPLEAPDAYRAVTSPWSDNAFGLDMEAARTLAANTCVRATPEAKQLLAAPQRFATLDYGTLEGTDVQARLAFDVTRAGTCHGWCLWFDSRLAPGVELSNAPGREPLIYKTLVLPLPRPVELQAGTAVDVDLRADLVGGDYVWCWKSRFGAEAFEQSELLGAAISPATLRKQAASHVPVLNEQGEIDRLVLDLMRESMSVGDIAQRVAAAFPARFPGPRDALTRVGELSVRYGR